MLRTIPLSGSPNSLALSPDNVHAVTANIFEDTVSLVDNGGAEFDVTLKRDVDTDSPLEERKPGGLGVHLVQNLVDTLEYEYQDGRGEVIFTKGSGT